MKSVLGYKNEAYETKNEAYETKKDAYEPKSDFMIRDPDPKFQENVERQIYDSLREKAARTSEDKRDKMINWNIINHGKQTIIVL